MQMKVKTTMKTSDFYYDLPEQLIAQTPVEPRDSARLLVYDRAKKRVEHRIFRDVTDYLKKGDVLLAIRTADYNLRHYENLNDSTVVMNLRMILHFVGDMHCPTHSYFPGPRCFWPCTLNGKPQKSFHSVYDKMPNFLYKKVASEDVAKQIDNLKKGQIKKIQRGTLLDWVKDIADHNAVIYEWNPFNTKELNPDTVEFSRDLVNTQMRNAGYRLARLLNEYFDK